LTGKKGNKLGKKRKTPPHFRLGNLYRKRGQEGGGKGRDSSTIDQDPFPHQGKMFNVPPVNFNIKKKKCWGKKRGGPPDKILFIERKTTSAQKKKRRPV